MSNSKPAVIESSDFEVTIDTENKIATIALFGVINLKHLVDSFSELVRHPDFEKNICCCYDCRDALIEVNLTETEIFYHFSAGMRSKRGTEYNIAFISGDEMTEMLVQFYRLFLVRSEIHIESFKTSEEAIQWLLESRLPIANGTIEPFPDQDAQR
ncbi:hypothetical protein FLL45_08580 [Aliikangiella marina]|uniref:STAS/SEC14 domain-containing protein n=1 Tax=Aliikangiella marina TaxID=1712262 RepID=A0A545TCP3_9GAMM|nr:hypothetical protein [Aliikangiella marina]TQV74988.1 hypothetical protein FLL45_08580 [Aliikangiella marina]